VISTYDLLIDALIELSRAAKKTASLVEIIQEEKDEDERVGHALRANRTGF